MLNRHDVVILEGARTPFCRAGTLLADVSARELGRTAVREAIERAEVTPHEIDEVIVGNIASPHEAANVGRVIALEAGVPQRVPAYTVNRNCGSALQAIADAALRIRAGEAEIVVAAGVESMSQIPVLYPESFKKVLLRAARAKSAWQRASAFASLRTRDFKPVIALEAGLTDPVSGMNMGQTAELLARDFGITREEQDAFALESHARTTRAWSEGRLTDEVVPLPLPPRFDSMADRDNGHRENQSIEALGKLRPYFDREYGTVTAGNSSQLTDGAAALVLSSESKARAIGGSPIGRLRSFAFAACEPERMGLGPAYAIPLALRRAGLTLKDIELVEINEAFAAQVIACERALASSAFAAEKLNLAAPVGTLDRDRLNVNGGAIAIGHPVGATGARLVLTLLKEMARRGAGLGLAALCIGGGQGAAVVVERY